MIRIVAGSSPAVLPARLTRAAKGLACKAGATVVAAEVRLLHPALMSSWRSGRAHQLPKLGVAGSSPAEDAKVS